VRHGSRPSNHHATRITSVNCAEPPASLADTHFPVVQNRPLLNSQARKRAARQEHAGQRPLEIAEVLRCAIDRQQSIIAQQDDVHDVHRRKIARLSDENQSLRGVISDLCEEIAELRADKDAQTRLLDDMQQELAKARQEGHTFVLSLPIDESIQLITHVDPKRGAASKIPVVEHIRDGHKVVVLLQKRLAADARTVKAAIHTLVMAFDCIASLHNHVGGQPESDQYDAACKLVVMAQKSVRPITLLGGPPFLYTHTGSRLHAQLPLAAAEGNLPGLWCSSTCGAAWAVAVACRFPVLFVGTGPWAPPQHVCVAKHATACSGMSQVSMVKVGPILP